MRLKKAVTGLLCGLCVWGLVYLYISLTNTTSYYPPNGKQGTLITADCRHRRFGNAMFNYAALLGMAKKINRTAVLPYDLSIRKLFKCPMLNGGFEFNFGSYSVFYDGGRSGTYNPNMPNVKDQNIKLIGFFQSWKYFTNVEDELRHKHFVLHPEISSQADKHMQDAVIRHSSPVKNRIIVGVHVRRGDMLYAHLHEAGFVPATHQYFQKAMDYFRDRFKNVWFFICTDSPEWVKLNIYGEDILMCDGRSASVDFAILSKCNHSIISVGSFGWWAAWIANGITVYYDDWPKPNTRLAYEVTKKDYFFPHWIPMN